MYEYHMYDCRLVDVLFLGPMGVNMWVWVGRAHEHYVTSIGFHAGHMNKLVRQSCLALGETWDEQMAMTIHYAKKSAQDNKGKIDWEWVKKAVAKTEPPRMQDVPAHVKFLTKYGGGAQTQHLMLRTMRILEMKMPSGRIVSGSFFDRVASLKLPPKEEMPHVMHGCIILQAIGDKERESIGSIVTDAHVRSLAGNKKSRRFKGEQHVV